MTVSISSSQPSSTRPNVLVFMMDQCRADILERKDCFTPNFDRLLKRGVHFPNAYTPNPVCSPARASFMTGRLPHNHGVLMVTHNVDDDQSVLRTSLPHWGQRLREAGYTTGYFGKWHVERSHDLTPFGWDEFSLTDDKLVEPLLEQHTPRRNSGLPSLTLTGPPGYQDALWYQVLDVEPASFQAAIVTHEALKFIDRSNQSSKQWCCYVGTQEPHDPFCCSKSTFERYREIRYPTPNEVDWDQYPNLYRLSAANFQQIGEEDYQNIMRCYFASVTELDAQFGRLIDRLEVQGTLDHTLILVTSDHGEFLGSHGLYCKNIGAFEAAYRIPFIMAGPGIRQGAVSSARVGLQDFAPTLIDLLGLPSLSTENDSTSFLRILFEGSHDGDFQTGFAEYYGTRLCLTQRIYWAGPWKYVFNGFDEDELYHLENDPGERFNLINEAALEELRQFMVSGEPEHGIAEWEDEEFKAILTYELDFEDMMEPGMLSQILGRHNFTAIYSDREEETINLTGRDAPNFSGGSVAAALMQMPFDSNGRRITARRFHFPSGQITPVNAPVAPIAGVEGELFDVDTQSFQPTTIGSEFFFRGSTSSWTVTEIESVAFVWQGHFWNDRIVGTFGFRDDDADTFIQDGEPPLNNVGAPIFSEWELVDEPVNESDQTTTFGVVVKPFDWFNLHYNDSENFVPSGTRLDLFGNTIAPQSGTGEDYGFSFNLMEDKLFVKFNWFEVSQKNVTQDALTAVAFWRIARFEFPENLQADLEAAGLSDLWQPAPDGHPGRVEQLKTTTNFETEGLEIEAVYNPIPNWRILLNVARQETVQSNMAPAMREFIDLRLPFFESLPIWSDPNFGTGGFTWEEFWNLIVTEPAEFELAQEGTTTAQQREWRANIVTNYEFTEDFLPGLRGVNVGGAIRWQGSPIIGFREGEPTSTGNPTLDSNAPITGETDTTVDFWIGYSRTLWDDRINWSIQLNVQDVFSDDDFIPIRANPDGSTATSRVPLPTNYFITSTFSF